jgi:hypothetical protein
MWAPRLGRWQSPGTRGEVQLHPLWAREFLSARSLEQVQPEICAPSPVWFLVDGGQRSGEPVRSEEAVAFLFMERSDASGGVDAGAEPQVRARLNIVRTRESPRSAV